MNDLIKEITGELACFTEEDLVKHLATLRARRPTMTLNFPSTHLEFEDYTQKGFDLIESGGMKPTLSGEVVLDFVSVVKPGESPVSGSVMLGRAVELGGNPNQWDREIVLANQSLIPVSLREKWLVFPATKWRDRDSGREYVPIADWDDDCWIPRLALLGDGWRAGDFLLVPRK